MKISAVKQITNYRHEPMMASFDTLSEAENYIKVNREFPPSIHTPFPPAPDTPLPPDEYVYPREEIDEADDITKMEPLKELTQ